MSTSHGKAKQKLTTPTKLRNTAKHFEKENLSAATDGNTAAKIRVKRLEDEDRTLTTPASVLEIAS